MNRYCNLTYVELIDVLDRHCYVADVHDRGIEPELAREVVSRMLECLRRFEHIEEIAKGVV